LRPVVTGFLSSAFSLTSALTFAAFRYIDLAFIALDAGSSVGT
jgi:hypothetical protein